MTRHSQRGTRRRTAGRLAAAAVLVNLWGASGVSLAQTFEVVRSFVPAPNGLNPYAGLIQASDGSFYGTTSSGGAYTSGTVFKIDAAGTLTTLHSFTGGGDGYGPTGGVIQASDGSFYGTTGQGGASGHGTVFKMDAAGAVTTLHSFTGGSDGHGPSGGVIQARDGSFYGTTQQGGASGYGTVFKLDAAGSLMTLYSFTNRGDGASPDSGVIQAKDGSFYGTTWGGAYERGTVFKLDAAGTLTTLHSFTGSDGLNPRAALIQASDGSFYGCSRSTPPGR